MRTHVRLLGFLALISLGDRLLIQAQERPTGPPSGQDAKAPPKLGTIRGRVIATDTGAGLSKTSLMLMSSEPQGRERPLTAKTNAEGDYELKEVKPGRYHLRANRNGYVNQGYGQKASDTRMSQGTLVVVRAGETLSQVDFKLIRGGIVEGRVLDSDGEPLAHVQVMLERFMTLEGKRNLRPMGGGSTDDEANSACSASLQANTTSVLDIATGRPKMKETRPILPSIFLELRTPRKRLASKWLRVVN
jgi:hypothetical protein